MSRDGKSRRFLYVEVPLPTARARAARSAGSSIHRNNEQSVNPLDEAGPQKGSIPSVSPVPSLKGKGRQLEDDPLPTTVRRSGSSQQSAQAASGPDLAMLFDDDAVAGPSVSPRPLTSLKTTLQAPTMLHIGSSSSSTLTALAPDTEGSISLPKQKTNTKRRRRQKRIIAGSDASDQSTLSSGSGLSTPSEDEGGLTEEPVESSRATPASSPVLNSKIRSLHKSNQSTSSEAPAASDAPPKYTPLGVDEEITKILGRKRYMQEYAYTVKLKGGQRALVSLFFP